MKSILICLVVVLTILGFGHAQATDKIIEPCSLLTLEQASEILGGKPSPGREIQGAIRTCSWSFIDKNGWIGSIRISVLQNQTIDPLWKSQGVSSAEQYFKKIKSDMATKTVPGIGDEAFWLGELYVLRTGMVYQFDVHLSPEGKSIEQSSASDMEASKKLAVKILASNNIR